MPFPETWLAFLGTAAIFAFIPGPGMLYAAAQTMAGGRTSGLMAMLGIHLGGYVHVLAVAAGLAALLEVVPSLYWAVKLGGALYLAWMGLAMMRAPVPEAMAAASRRTGWRAFANSVAVEILNPKAALFYLALLPQFADAATATPLWVQLMVLGAVVNLMFTLADLVAVLMAEAMMTRLRRSLSLRRWMQRAGGAILMGLGLRIALSDR